MSEIRSCDNKASYTHPDKEKCLGILHEYGTPERVIRHCTGVARVAVLIGNRLNQCGFNLDMKLINAAAMLHDVARVKDEHWIVGSEYLRSLGLEKEADIVKVHMHYPVFSPPEKTNETDVVCLADRLVMEDEYVGLERRIQYVIDKVNGDAEIEAIVRKKMAEAQEFIKGIEKIMGITIDDLVKKSA